MKTSTTPSDTLFVLFGAGGDLSWRMVVPALFNLFLDGHLPQRFLLLAIDRSGRDDATLAQHYYKGITEHSRRGEPTAEAWLAFSSMIRCIKLDAADPEGYGTLAKALDEQEAKWGSKSDRVFYMATPPSLFDRITLGLSRGRAVARSRSRAAGGRKAARQRSEVVP